MIEHGIYLHKFNKVLKIKSIARIVRLSLL